MSTIYLGTIDAGGKGDELLIRAINAVETTNYNLDDFAFGEPEPVTNILNPTHNTKILLAPYAATGHYGVRTVFYNRIHASELPAIIIPWEGERYISDLLPKINNKYGIYIEAKDINDGQVPTPSSGATNVQLSLEFKSSSIIFYSSTMIQIGQNDPTGDTGIIEEFATDLTLIANNSEQIKKLTTEDGKRNDWNYLLQDFTSIAVDRYPNRQAIKNVEDSFFGNDILSINRRNVLLDNTNYGKSVYNLLVSDVIPFVGLWMDTNNITHAMTVTGETYSLDATGKVWSYVGNPINYQGLDTAEGIKSAYRNINVKALTQSSDGKVYVVALSPAGMPSVYQIPQNGSAAAAEIAISRTRSIAMDANAWTDIVVNDFVVRNGTVGVIISSISEERNITYPSDSPTGTTLPAAEIFKINGINTYYSLTDNTKIGADIVFRTPEYGSNDTTIKNMRFIDQAADEMCFDIVSTHVSDWLGTLYPVILRYSDGVGYKAQFLPFEGTTLPAFNGVFEIVGYRIPATNMSVMHQGAPVTGAYVEVVEMICPVETDAKSRYFDKFKERLQNGWQDYGVHVWSATATSPTVTTAWTRSSYPMRGSGTPRFVTVHGNGVRQFYVAQSGNAIVRTRLTQDIGSSVFKAAPGYTVGLEAVRPNTRIQGIACAKLQPWSMVLDTNYTTILSDRAPLTTVPDIEMSFIGHNNNKPAWLIQSYGNIAPTFKTVVDEQRYLGEIPVLVMSHDNFIAALSQQGIVYASENYGLNWHEYATIPSFYEQETPVSDTIDYSGIAKVALQQKSFREGVFTDGGILLDADITADVQIVDNNTGELSQAKTFNERLLLSTVDRLNQYSQTSSKELDSFGVNYLSKFSPRRLQAWDSDSLSNTETIGLYTKHDSSGPLAEQHNYDLYLFGVDGELMDFSRDVRYLGFRHWVLMKETTGSDEVWRLHFTNGSAPERTVGLFGATDTESFPTFKPQVSFHLWDFHDELSEYIPYVFVDGTRVLILERLDNESKFAVTQRTMAIPNDNGNPLVAIPMYSANRRDYYFYQKGNGVFSILYTFINIASGSNVSLVRVSSLNSAGLRDVDIVSGCRVGVAAKDAPLEALIPDNLPPGADMGWICRGDTKVIRKADGNGGFTETTQPYSTDCGYVPPPTQMSGRAGIEGTGDTTISE